MNVLLLRRFSLLIVLILCQAGPLKAAGIEIINPWEALKEPFVTDSRGVKRRDLVINSNYAIALGQIPPHAEVRGINGVPVDMFTYVLSGKGRFKESGKQFNQNFLWMVPQGGLWPEYKNIGDKPIITIAVVSPPPPIKTGTPNVPSKRSPAQFINMNRYIRKTLASEAPERFSFQKLRPGRNISPRLLEIVTNMGPLQHPSSDLLFLVYRGKIIIKADNKSFTIGKNSMIRIPVRTGYTISNASGKGARAFLVELSVPAAGN
ncbi:MAG: hypothetical protein A3J74_00155 [Elusimicrobia bacterium RIFCSPHIGHO2_02_FULL_57_9]|nr:MAG: hypothetical protein A3J74_00155 [Elusimicrobia bacterium RIFCSPHIGHO2_02_FULL_57_9]